MNWARVSLKVRGERVAMLLTATVWLVSWTAVPFADGVEAADAAGVDAVEPVEAVAEVELVARRLKLVVGAGEGVVGVDGGGVEGGGAVMPTARSWGAL